MDFRTTTTARARESSQPPTLKRVTAAIASAVLLSGCTAGLHLPPVDALPHPVPDREHELVDEVYTLVRKYYVDPTYNGVDWDLVYEELMAKPLTSHNETYKETRAMVARLGDAYTRLLKPEDMERLRKYDVSGVGLLLTANSRGQLAVASEPLPASSAGKVGIRRGDVVVSVDGVSLEGRSAFRAAELMQGDDGTSMRVGIRSVLRDSDHAGTGGALGPPREVELVRRFAEGGGAKVEWSLDIVGSRKVGYVRLADFSASSRGDVESALRNLDARGADAYVLDLRHNPGGVFEGALEIAGLFSGRDVAVARVTSRGANEELFRSRIVGDASNEMAAPSSNVAARDATGRYAGGAVVAADAPLAVIVDGGSASSSEVLGGALRDNCRAVIAGSRHSFGKGLIQGVFGLSDGGGAVVTVARYRTPSGAEIQGSGLTPTTGVADGPMDALGRLVRRQGAGAAVDFDDVEEQLQMCKVEAAKSRNRARIFPSSPFGSTG